MRFCFDKCNSQQMLLESSFTNIATHLRHKTQFSGILVSFCEFSKELLKRKYYELQSQLYVWFPLTHHKLYISLPQQVYLYDLLSLTCNFLKVIASFVLFLTPFCIFSFWKCEKHGVFLKRKLLWKHNLLILICFFIKKHDVPLNCP